jgi:hypothetical protein
VELIVPDDFPQFNWSGPDTPVVVRACSALKPQVTGESKIFWAPSGPENRARTKFCQVLIEKLKTLREQRLDRKWARTKYCQVSWVK